MRCHGMVVQGSGSGVDAEHPPKENGYPNETFGYEDGPDENLKCKVDMLVLTLTDNNLDAQSHIPEFPAWVCLLPLLSLRIRPQVGALS